MHKEIVMLDTIPKYVRIRELLEADVRQGVYMPGERLPSLRELAVRFNTTPVTLSKSLELLEGAGWIVCRHGKGIYAAECLPVCAKFSATVLLSAQGHLFSSLFMSLLNELQEHGHSVCPIDLPHGADVSPAVKYERMHRAIRSAPDAYLIDGDAYFPFESLSPVLMGKTTFLFRCETDREVSGANRITPDFTAIGMQAAAHLTSAGASKLLFLGFQDFIGEDGLGFPYSYQRKIWMGFHQFCINHQIECEVILQDHGRRTNELSSVLCVGTGCFCIGDFRAVGVYQACAQMNLQIGTEVFILGLFDTPWCESLTPTLSSISINEPEIARQARRLLEARIHGEIVQVPSEVIVRKSTGVSTGGTA